MFLVALELMMLEFDDVTFETVEAVLESIRPSLEANGSWVRLSAIEGRKARVVLEGGFRQWPTSRLALSFGIERALREKIPGFGGLITDVHEEGEMP